MTQTAFGLRQHGEPFYILYAGKYPLQFRTQLLPGSYLETEMVTVMRRLCVCLFGDLFDTILLMKAPS